MLTDPQAIRDGLPEAERDTFDVEYQRALAVARDELRLDDLQSTLRIWAGTATALATGEPPAGTVTRDEFRQRGLRVFAESLIPAGADCLMVRPMVLVAPSAMVLLVMLSQW